MLHRLHRVATWFVLVASPIRLISTLRIVVPLPVQAEAATLNVVPYQLTLDTTQAQAITVQASATPNFDTDVLQPLRVAQAKAQAEAQAAQVAAQAKAKANVAHKAVTTSVVSAAVSDENLAKLRYCEAGGIYTRNSGNGYYGAYQYGIGSWANFGGYARADLAPADVQDAKVRADATARGWSAWPSCARQLGLM